VILTDIIMN